MLDLGLGPIEVLELMVRFLFGPSASRDRLARAGRGLSVTESLLESTAKPGARDMPDGPDSTVLSLLPRGLHDEERPLTLLGRELGTSSRSESEFSAS